MIRGRGKGRERERERDKVEEKKRLSYMVVERFFNHQYTHTKTD